MLEYDWGNQSAMMLSGDETTQESDQNRQFFDPYNTQTYNESASFLNPNAHFSAAAAQTHHQFHHPLPPNAATHYASIYDPRAYTASSYSHQPPPHQHPTSMLSLDPTGGPAGFMVVPKSEPVVIGGVDFGGSSRIGLNLGGRTYFSSSEDDFVNRLYRRSRAAEPGSINSPRCQAEGCNADLTHAKHYHRRHKVCEFHSKAATVIASGLTQRFCQQCSRFHLLSEFDNGKRSCRKRLADHNRRRRKNHHSNQESSTKSHENARNSSSESLARSPQDSGIPSSSVTVAISPPRISLDCFRQRSYHHAASTTTSSASTSSLFFSSN